MTLWVKFLKPVWGAGNSGCLVRLAFRLNFRLHSSTASLEKGRSLAACNTTVVPDHDVARAVALTALCSEVFWLQLRFTLVHPIDIHCGHIAGFEGCCTFVR